MGRDTLGCNIWHLFMLSCTLHSAVCRALSLSTQKMDKSMRLKRTVNSVSENFHTVVKNYYCNGTTPIWLQGQTLRENLS